MFEAVDKALLAGLGALSMTRERAEQLFDRYVDAGRQAREERSGFVKDVMDRAEKTRAELEKIVREQVQDVVSKLDLATKQDIERLEKKLDAATKKKQG